ncbi:MAG: hypothetical protein Q8L48_42730 [Archangium sp.]|nr:hypothetical protein [Archangium sp.]
MKRLFWVTAVVGGVVGALFLFRHAVLSGDLWVSNGTPLEVEVSIDGSTFLIEPGANQEVGRFGAGARELVTRRKRDGLELDRRTVIFQRTMTHVYNVLGAAPVTLSTIIYSTHNPINGGTPPVESSMCGNDFLSSDVHYVFKEPPRSIQMEKRSGDLRKVVLSIDPGGFTRCLQQLGPQPSLAAAFAARLAPVLEDAGARASMAWFAATLYAREGDAPTALALATPLLEGDDSVETHRSYQGVLQSLGRDWQAKQTYRLRFEGDRSETNAYLYARLLGSKEALALLEPWAKGSNPWVHRSLLWHHGVLGQHEAALEESEWCLAHVDAQDVQRPGCLEQRARALVGLGKASLAMTGLEDEYEKFPQLTFDVALLLDRVARKAERKPRFATFARLPTRGTDAAIYRLFYDLSLGGPPPKNNSAYRGFTVLEEARTNPRQALERLDADAEGLRYVGQELATLLLGEALRTRQRSASRKLYNLLPPGVPLADLEAWVRDGEERVDLSDFEQTSRAAYYFARARRLESLGEREKADVFYREARQADLLEGLAVRALTDWPGPERVNEGVLERVEGLVLPVQQGSAR